MPASCSRQPEIVRAEARGWTDPDDGALAAHAALCAHCLETMAAAAGIRAECARDLAAARVPSSAVVWWRLERRLREDRARAARRALTVAHGVAGAVAAGVTLAVAEAVSPFLRPTLAAGWTMMTVRSTWTTVPDQWGVPLALMAAALLVLAPTAIYLGLKPQE